MKYDKARVKKICDMLEGGNTREDSAILSGIGKATFYEWLKDKVDFADAIKEAEARCLAQHIANVRRHAFGLDGTQVRWTASAWWLERTCPERFAQKWQGQLGGLPGKPLAIEATIVKDADTARFTDAQLDKLIAATELMSQPKKSDDIPANGNGHTESNGHS